VAAPEGEPRGRREHGLPQRIAMEGREDGIRANSISPGLIETNQTVNS
jgi:NAD(P)-dependent dehydrogenase (short-subunit alcohol dehydrogenase family)